MRRISIAILAWAAMLAHAQWSQVPGALKYVSVGSASNIWGTNASGNIWRWNGSTWQQMPGQLKQVSAAADGTVWGVSSYGTPFRWNGKDWDATGGRLSAISVGSATQVYGITEDQPDGNGGELFFWTGTTWARSGSPTYVPYSSVSADAAGNLWLTDIQSRIRYRPSGASIGSIIAGGLVQVSSAGQYVMGVNNDGQIWRWTGRTWRQVPGALRWVSVSSDGQMWGVNASGNIFRGTATAPDPQPVPAANGTYALPYGQYLTDGQCLVSTNRRYQACINQGMLVVQQTPSNTTYYASPYGPEVDVNGNAVTDNQLVSDTDGSVCIANPRGRRWCAVDTSGTRSVVWMQDDGNLCAYPGTNLTSISGQARWCSNTGHGAMQKALQAYPQTEYSDMKTAMQLFDSGTPLLVAVSVYKKLLFDYDSSACYELTNNANRPLMVESFWYGNESVRDWAVIPPGQKLRFDNRGGSFLACMNCDAGPGAGSEGNISSRHFSWGSQMSLDLIAVKDNWPAGGCRDMLGLGPSHPGP